MIIIQDLQGVVGKNSPLEILIRLKEAIQEDTKLKSWLNSEYNKDLTIFLGKNDKEVEPSSDLYPCLIFEKLVTSERSRINRDDTHSFILSLCLLDERSAEDITGGKIYTGFTNIEIFRILTEQAIFKVNYGKVSIQSENLGDDIAHPLYAYSLIVSVQVRNLKRG